MADQYPFGADTLVIPFTRDTPTSEPPRVARMSRMRPRGELFRHGVANRIDPAGPPDDEKT